jgi:hypothetical protein
MKARTLFGWLTGMVLAGGLAAPGLAQGNLSPVSDKPTTAAPSPPSAVAPSSSGAETQPAKVQLSAGAMEIQRLTQAGLSEGVILAYVTNSPHRYSLTPDQIIDLKHAGVAPRIISAMITHDQALPAEPPPYLVAAAPPRSLAVPIPEDEGPSIVVDDGAWPAPSMIADDEGYAPEQPANLGPVRAPYPVKLNDPILVLKLPSFTIPYW